MEELQSGVDGAPVIESKLYNRVSRTKGTSSK